MATPRLGRPDVMAARRAGSAAPAWREGQIPRAEVATRIESCAPPSLG